MKNNLQKYGIIAFVVLAALCGCKKKSTLDQIPAETVAPADTGFSEPAPFSGVDTSDDASFLEAELEAEMQRKVRENLQTVYFDFNSYELTSASSDMLQKASKFLMEYSNLRVLVEGHCDERGSSDYNMGLGENRARAVKNYLTNYGIQSIQIEITSWGKERPAESGCTHDECHSRNRRAEFKVLAK